LIIVRTEKFLRKLSCSFAIALFSIDNFFQLRETFVAHNCLIIHGGTGPLQDPVDGLFSNRVLRARVQPLTFIALTCFCLFPPRGKNQATRFVGGR
jgi:hypothetical protein